MRIENTQDIRDLWESLKILEQQIPMINASLRRAFLSWICHVIAPPHKGLQLETRDVESLIEVREMLSARIKQWEKEIADKNLEKGLEKGRKEGLEKGEFIGEAKTLEKMLVLKFGSLPDWAEQRVAQANSTLLDQWIENLFDADNLENIFKSLSRSVKYFITPIVRQSYNSNIFSFDNTNACVLL